MSKVQIIVNLYGGVVQDVFCSAQDAELILVDWATDGCVLSDGDVARVADSNGRENLAFVSKRFAGPLASLAGTDAEAAVRYAREHAFEDFKNEPITARPNSAG